MNNWYNPNITPQHLCLRWRPPVFRRGCWRNRKSRIRCQVVPKRVESDAPKLTHSRWPTHSLSFLGINTIGRPHQFNHRLSDWCNQAQTYQSKAHQRLINQKPSEDLTVANLNLDVFWRLLAADLLILWASDFQIHKIWEISFHLSGYSDF